MSAPATTNNRNAVRPSAPLVLPNMAGTSQGLQSTLRQVLERLSVLDGQRGDELDSAVTKRDLIELGLTELGDRNAGQPVIVPVETDSEWNNIPYLTAMPTPDPPTFKLGIGFNMLFWTLPNARGVASTEIFRRTNDTDGTIIASALGSMYADIPVEFSTTYYYKIRYVSELGVVGDWSAEVSVTSEPDPVFVIDSLHGKLGESELSEALRGKLDLDGVVRTTVTALDTKYAGLVWDAVNGTKRAGFGILNDGTVSSFAINADQFYLLQGDVVPFSVVDGVAYLNTAFIKDATIDVAKIRELNLAVANIVQAYIQDVEIGGDITSSNYSGVLKTGWGLFQDGSGFFGSNVVFGGALDVRAVYSGGARTEIRNTGMKVYDSAGTLRVRIGDLTA